VGLRSALLPSIFPTKPCMYLSSLPYVLHALPISVFLILSPELQLISHIAYHKWSLPWHAWMPS
jgi:hypothetical protein